MINWANFEAERENAAAGYRCELCGCEPCQCPEWEPEWTEEGELENPYMSDGFGAAGREDYWA